MSRREVIQRVSKATISVRREEESGAADTGRGVISKEEGVTTGGSLGREKPAAMPGSLCRGLCGDVARPASSQGSEPGNTDTTSRAVR